MGNWWEVSVVDGTTTSDGVRTASKRYISAGGVLAVVTQVNNGSWTLSYLLTDHLGSVTVSTNELGVTATSAGYSYPPPPPAR